MSIGVYQTRGHEQFYVDDTSSDESVRKMMEIIYAETAAIHQSFWNEASIDQRFYGGDQSVWNEVYSGIPSFRRKQFSFNKIRRIINMVSGYQRRNRKSTILLPQGPEDQEVADQMTEVLMWCDNQNDMGHIISDAFQGALVTGLNLLGLWMDYRSDPLNGDIRVENLGYSSFLVDPYFKRQDLKDCNYIWTRKFLSKKQIASLMPDRKDEIMSMNRYESKDGKFTFLPENYNIVNSSLLSYDEFWYLDFKDVDLLIDQETGQQMEWEGPKENLKFYLSRFPQVKMVKTQKQTCKLCTRVNGKVFYNGPNPYGIDQYPFIPVLGYHNPDLLYFQDRVQGMVRNLRDSQFLYNRRQQIMLDILESQVNSGLKVMEGSLIDDADAFKTSQGQAIFIKKDAPLGLASIEKIPAAEVPPSLFALSEMLSKDIMDISGVNEELLGSADDDKAGILSMLRQGAGLTTLQLLFDQVDLSQKLLGQLQIQMIQKNFQPSKIKRILNKEPAAQFYNRDFGKFDCQVVEGVNTPNQRMIAFQQALYLRELGIPVPTKFLLEMSNMQRKKDFIDDVMQQEQQQAQMQQQQAQVQMMELQARGNLANARAEADIGLAKERESRVLSNIALSEERRMEAVKDLEQATLDKIKAVKELEGMDLNQLKSLLDVIDRLRALNEVQQEVEENAVPEALVSNETPTMGI